MTNSNASRNPLSRVRRVVFHTERHQTAVDVAWLATMPPFESGADVVDAYIDECEADNLAHWFAGDTLNIYDHRKGRQ